MTAAHTSLSFSASFTQAMLALSGLDTGNTVLSRISSDLPGRVDVRHYFINILTRLEKRLIPMGASEEEQQRVPTAGVDGVTLTINETFWNSLSPFGHISLLLHEAAHIALGHTLKEGKPPVAFTQLGRHAYNMACEIAANKAASITKGIEKADSTFIPGVTLSNVNSHLKDKLKTPLTLEMTTHEYFYAILEALQQEGGEKAGEGMQAFDVVACDGDGEGTEEGKADKAIDTLNGDMLRAVLGDILRQAARAANLQGNPDGAMQELYNNLDIGKPAKTKWETLLRAAISRTFSSEKEQSAYRVNRRMPFVYPGYKRKPKLEVDVVVDTSGSMYGDHIQAALRETESLLKLVGGKMKLICVDTEAHVSTVNSAKDIALVGGGGTDLTPGLAATRAKCVVVITDGGHYGPPLKCPKGASVVFAIVGGADRCEGASFGRVVKIEKQV